MQPEQQYDPPSTNSISQMSATTSKVIFHPATHEDEESHSQLGLQPQESISNRKKSPTLNNSTTTGLTRSTSAVYELASAQAPHMNENASSGSMASMATSSSAALLLNNNSQSSSSLSSSSASSSSASLTRRRRPRRLPQSGLTLCGRRWLLGAEDMCLPACWSSQFDLLLVIISIAAWVFIYTSQYPDTCTQHDKDLLEVYVAMHVVGYAALLTLDVSTMLSSLYSNMFKKNRTIVYLIYLRLLITLFVVVFTLMANVAYFQDLRPACSPDEDHAGSIALHRLLTLLFISSLSSFLVFGSYFICSYGFGPCCGKGTAESWSKHLKRWLLCYDPAPTTAGGRNVLESISWIFTEFFAADRAAFEGEAIHIVPSDILVGFALIEANQVRRAVDGYEFLKSAPKNRWSPDAFQTHHRQAGKRNTNDADDLLRNEEDTFQKSYGVNGYQGKYVAEQIGTKQLKLNVFESAPTSSSSSTYHVSSPSPDPLVAAEKGLYATARALERKESVTLPHEQPDSILALKAGQGEQPALDPRDWQKIADAKHFSKYALGSYGWLLYTFNNLGCLLTCRACRCCHRAEYDHKMMIGSGCGAGCLGTSGCCHWSIASFLLTTGVADKDIIYANLAAAPVYYLTVDHHQKCVVICCRGTLSVSDAVIDLDAQLSPLDNYGYAGGYTHMGILENAIRLRDDLDERGHLARFLEQHPAYNITIVGHSLGAATAALLTLLLRERYDTGPPPVATASRLTHQTRNRLTCIAYGCPLLLDLGVAHSEFALRCITTIVNHSDIISRLSLATCALLKDQMISCFAVSSSSKFRILSNSLRKNYEQSFEPGTDMHAVASPHLLDEGDDDDASPGGVSSTLTLGTIARAMDKLEILPENKEDEETRRTNAAVNGTHRQFSQLMAFESGADSPNGPSPIPLLPSIQPSQRTQANTRTSPGSHSDTSQLPSIPAVVVTSHSKPSSQTISIGSSTTSPSPPSTSSASATGTNEFTMHLRKCYLPGRIYHLLPGTRNPANKRCFGLRRAPRDTVIYPSAQDTFQEIVVNKTMFHDHLPEHYQLDRVQIPHEFLEPRDDEETPPPSASPPPPHRVEMEDRL